MRTQDAQALPLFLVHDNFGTDVYFSVLSAHIDSDIPILGLPAVPTDRPQPSTMAELAARHVRMIRSAQPAGPYRIAGWSFGGVLAYEIAQQLLRLNQTVEFVGLLDTYCPVPQQRYVHSVQEHLLAICANNFALAAEQRAEISRLRILGELPLPELLRECRTRTLLPGSLTDSSDAEISQFIARHVAHLLALERYIPQPLQTPVQLFLACEGIYLHEEQPLRGWTRVFPPSQLVVTHVPGDHYSMMRVPAVAELGRAISLSLAVLSDGSNGTSKRGDGYLHAPMR